MEQHYLYGKFLRDRYTLTLDSLYNKNKVFIRSTNVDRTIMSANSMLAGLFPPQDYQQFDPSINWQPIPVHTYDLQTDPIFFPTNNCPRYVELKKSVLNSKEYLEENKKHQVHITT